MSAPLVVTPYPPSAGLRDELKRELGEEPEYLLLTRIGRLRKPSTLWELRRYRGRRAYVVVEDEASTSAIPVLHAVAAAAGASSIELRSPILPRRRLRRGELARGVAGSVAATATWSFATRRLRERMLRELVSAPRLDARPGGMRALYLNANLWFGLKAGGSVAHVAGVVNGLVENGYSVDFFGPGEAPLLDPSVRVHALGAPTPLALRQEANVERFQRQAIAAINRDAQPPYAFLYQRNSLSSYAGIVASRRLGVPLVLEYNGSEVWTSKRWGYGLRYEELATLAEEASLHHAALVVTVSDVSRDELLERGVPPERVVTYPNGVDAERYRPDVLDADERAALRKRYGIPADALVGGFIGTFGQWHGVDVLARAIVRLGAESPEIFERHRLHFLLVGDGLRMPEVEETLSGSRAAAHVTLSGLVPQVEGPAHLAAADFLLSPHVPNPDGTRFFGSPTKLFEYMATGRAIIASDLEQIGEVLRPSLRVGSLPETDDPVDAEQLAVLAAPGDVGELVEALRWIVERPRWRDRLGENARARVLARHTWQHHVRAILSGLGDVS